MKRITISILFFLCAFITQAAKLPPVSTGVFSNPSLAFGYNVQDPKYTAYPGTWYNGFYNVSVKNRIVFKIDRDQNRHFNSSGDITINFSVNYQTYTPGISGLTPATQNHSIVLHYDTGYLSKEKDEVTIVIDNAVNSTVTISSVLYPLGVAYPAPMGYPMINFESILDIERIEKFNPTYLITPLQIIGVNPNTAGRNQFLRMSWAALPAWAEGVELEYLFVNSYTGLPSIGTGSYGYGQPILVPSSYSYNFRNNATRVLLEGAITSYEIPNLFPDGYVMFRVRPIGKHLARPEEWLQGKWTRNDDGVVNLTTISDAIMTTSPARTTLLTESKSSITSMSFSEGGKLSSLIEYYDGTLRKRQTTIYNYSTKVYMVSQSVYDYLGREAINIIPSVALDNTGFAFRSNFNISNKTGTAYHFSDFDYNQPASDEISVSSMKSTSGASKYFSSGLTSWLPGYSGVTNAMQQMHSFVPNAQGYPFSQGEFARNPTNRVIRAGGVGKQLQLTGFNDSGITLTGHESYIWDGTPFQGELDVLFGNEVGFADKYKKIMTKDQNGQITVAYTDPYGKTIATALAGAKPDNLDALASSSNSLSYNFTVPNNEEDILSGKKVIKQNFLVTSKDTWRFYYQYEIPKFNVPCDTSLCFSCGYTLTLSLKNSLGKELFPNGTPQNQFVGSPAPSRGSCGSVQKFSISPNPIVMVLDPGEYILTKVLKIDEKTRSDYKKMWLDSAKCLKSFEDFLDEEKEQMGLECEMDCEDCITEKLRLLHLVDSIRDYCTAHSIDTADYDPLWAAKEEYNEVKEICSDICMDKTPCDILLDAMIQDLSPGGQYAKYAIPGYDGNDSLKIPDNVLSEGSIFQGVDPKWWCNSVWPGSVTYDYNIPVWKQPLNLAKPLALRYVYLDDQGKEALIEVKDGKPLASTYVTIGSKTYARPHQLIDYNDFIKYFDEAWVQSLLYFHPEYCYYRKCRDINASYQYDNLLLMTENAKEAMQKGFYNPVAMTYNSTDTIIVNGAVRTINYSSYEGSVVRDPVLTYSFLNVNDLKTRLRGITINCDPSKKKSFWQIYERERANYGLNSPDTCVDELFWPLLRAHYLQQKREWLTKYYNDSCPVGVQCGNGVGGIRIRHFLINSGSDLAWDNVSDEDEDYVDKDLWAAENGCDPAQVESKISTQVKSYCETKCANNAEMWIQKLSSCTAIQGLSSTTLNNLKADLARLCESGCDLNNPYGSITRAPNADVSLYPDADLNTVFARYLGSNWFIKGVCDDLLIDFPGEYGHDYLATDDPDADTCACNNKKEVTASKRCPETGVDSLAIEDCACDKFDDLKKAALTRLSLEDQYKCKTCVSCDDLQEPVRQFLLKYKPEVESDSTTYQELLTTWLNRKFKFNLTYAEYSSYAYKCVDTMTDRSWVRVWQEIGLDRFISYNDFNFNNVIYDMDSSLRFKSPWFQYANTDVPYATDPFKERPAINPNSIFAAEGTSLYTDGMEYVTASPMAEKLACYCEKILNVDKLLVGPPPSSNTPSQLYTVLYGTYPSCLGPYPFQDVKNFCGNLWNMMGASTMPATPVGHKEGDKFNMMQLDWMTASFPTAVPGIMSCMSDGSCTPLPAKITERGYLDTCGCNMLKQLYNQWVSAGAKVGTGLEYKEYIYQQKGVNPDNPLELLGECDKFIRTDFDKDMDGNTPNWTLGQNFWTPISNENLNKYAQNKNYTVPKSFKCTLAVIPVDTPKIPGPSCFKLKDCNTMKDLIAKYLEDHPLPSGESGFSDYKPNGCARQDASLAAFDLLNNIKVMEDEIAKREHDNFIYSRRLLILGAGSVPANPPYDQTAIDDLRDWKNDFKSWFFDLHKDCDPMPANIDFDYLSGFYFLCKPNCSPKPVIFTSPKCESCYAIDTPWLKDFVKYNNQILTATNSTISRLVDSRWLLYSTSPSYLTRNLSDFYTSAPIYENRVFRQFLRYNIKQFKYPYLRIQIPDNNGYVLDYSMEFLGDQDWLNYGNITKFKNPRGARQQSCTPLQYFYVDVEIDVDKKYWDNSVLPAGESKCIECPTQWDMSGNPIGCKLTYTVLVRVNTKNVLKKVQCLTCAKLCNKPMVRSIMLSGGDCEEEELQTATENALLRYNDYLLGRAEYFDSLYTSKCFNAKDTFKVKYVNRQYQYTLFYFDRAANLIKTVPPEGIDIDNTTLTQANRQLLADNRIQTAAAHRKNNALAKALTYHGLISNFRYNTLDQVSWQKTPDGGLTKTWYDKLGRIVISQNDKQATQNKNTYTLFDDIGRVTEVGEIVPVVIQSMTSEMAADPASLASFLNVTSSPSNKTYVRRTYFDQPINISRVSSAFGVAGQLNYRNRALCNIYEKVNDNNDATYSQATYYSYDIHGNVIKAVQDIPDLEILNKHLYTIDYQFDLLSGKVNAVAYQKDKADQFLHNYYYDLDNRFLSVETSRDGYNWEQDLKQFYYLHGPIGRKEIGNLQVQGIDYAYTMQGYVKSVNSGSLSPDHDMGRDGSLLAFPYGSGVNPNKYVARDAYGYYLSFYHQDYISIGGQKAAPDMGNTSFNNKRRNLFNGNISHMGTAIPVMNGYWAGVPANQTQGNVYHYDQLNRVTKRHVFTHLNSSLNSWPATALNGDDKYYETFSYDANSNIKGLFRNGNKTSTSLTMDDFAYRYHTEVKTVMVGATPVSWTRLVSNRLYHVNDNVAAATYTDDIDDQGSFVSTSVPTSNNYRFDELGNMKADASEQIQEIKWNLYGKVESITRTAGSTKPDIEFGYSADGQRLYKLIKPKDNLGNIKQELEWTSTWYVRDAAGNIMATYKKKMNTTATANTYEEKLYADDWSIYGSERLGIVEEMDVMLSKREFTKYGVSANGSWADRTYTGPAVVTVNTGNVYTLVRGNKQYELSNHLGNVLVTVQDRKQSKDNNADNLTDYYMPYLRTVNDYYAYGSVMPGVGGAVPLCTSSSVQVNQTVYDVNEDFSGGSLGGFVAGSGSRMVTNPTGNQLHLEAMWTTRPLATRAVSLVNGRTYTLNFDINGFSVVAGYTHTVRVRILLPGSTLIYNYTALGNNTIVFTSNTTGTVNIEISSIITGSGSYIAMPYIDIDNFKLSWVNSYMSTVVTCQNADVYKYGMNGQMRDGGVSNGTDAYTAAFWEYEARLGRRWNTDPVYKEYESPYSCFLGNPVYNTDPNGDDPITGILEAASSFFLNIGMQVASGMLLQGQSYAQASANVDYVDATLDALSTYALSFFSSGAGTAAKIAKMAKTEVGQVVIDAVKIATGQLIKDYRSGKFNDEDGDFDSDNVLNSRYLSGLIKNSITSAIQSALIAKAAKNAKQNKSNNGVTPNNNGKSNNKNNNNQGTSNSNVGKNNGNIGTITKSSTVWRGKGKERIDVENPAPTQRPGQVHYQDNYGNKYIYDPVTGLFKDAPKRINDLLKNPEFKKGIDKGLRYLGY